MRNIRKFLAILQVTALLTGLIYVPVLADEPAPVSTEEAVLTNAPETPGEDQKSTTTEENQNPVTTEEEQKPTLEEDQNPETPEEDQKPATTEDGANNPAPTEEEKPADTPPLTPQPAGAVPELTAAPELTNSFPSQYAEYENLDGFTYNETEGCLYYRGLKLNDDAMYEVTDSDGTVWEYDPLDPEFNKYFGPKLTGENGEGPGFYEPDNGNTPRSGSSFASAINGQWYNYPSSVNGKAVINGVDVSKFQGNINWSALAARGVKFAIIRAGFRGYGDTGTLNTDEYCITNINGASAAGIKVGIYFFSQARDEAEARAEAQKCYQIIGGYKNKITLPVFMDYEYAGDDGYSGRLYRQHQADMASGDYRAKHTGVINAFCNQMASYGFATGVYADRTMFNDQVNVSGIGSSYYIWLANYTNNTPYSNRLECWQYTSSYSGFGSNIGSSTIDLDFWFGALPGENQYTEPVETDYGSPSNVTVSYRTHVQNIGWQGYRANGVMAGTSGMSLRLEGINIRVSGRPGLGVQYTTHCQDYGWLPWVSNDEMSGTTGESKRLEAIKIQLTGADKDLYDIWYRVHAENVGWMGWTKNGAPAGTAGYAYRLEGIQIVVTYRGAGFNTGVGGISSRTGAAYIDRYNRGDPYIPNANTTSVVYNTHVQNIGWQPYRTNGEFSGTSGQALRLEGIHVFLANKDHSGGVRYKTHVQNIGWQSWVSDGALAGTTGLSYRLEAINIELTGDMANYYDIYYRVHCQNIGWMGWARNGAGAGTSGFAYRLEGIQIVLVPKGSAAPSANYGGITSRESSSFIARM